VDEALAVGDAKFQARCMKRIRQLKEQGVTILFVSHDCSSVKMLCQRAALMSAGTLLNIGCPKDVVDYYIALLSSAQTQKETELLPSGSTDVDIFDNNKHKKIHRHGNKLATINSVKIKDLKGGDIKSKLLTESVFNIEVSLESQTEELSDLVVGFYISNLIGVILYGTNTRLMGIPLSKVSKGQRLVVSFQMPCYLNRGIYTITVGIHSEEGMSYDWMNEVIILEVTNSTLCDGLVDLRAEAKIL
jgi:lipopolysaccharide transport system ATP-binding protein